MKRKFKLIITLFLFLFNSTNLFAEDNCKNFFNLMKNERNKYQIYYLPSAPFVYYDAGFDFSYVWDPTAKDNEGSWVHSLSKDGYLIINKILHSKINPNIRQGDVLISVDEISVQSKEFNTPLKVFSYFEEAHKEDRKVVLKIRNKEKKIFEVNTDVFRYLPANTGVNISIKSINYIDQIRGEFEVYLENKFHYNFIEEDGLNRLAQETLIYQDNKGEYISQTCTVKKEFWDSLGSVSPIRHYKFANINKIDKDQIDQSVYLNPDSKKYGDDVDKLKLEDIAEGNYIFNNRFNLRSFPFDRQKLKILIYDNFYKPENRSMFSGSFMLRNLNRFLEEEDIPGWDIIGGKIKDTTFKDPNKTFFTSAISLEIDIERKHGYYIFKVIFPIILILTVCWSVVWVDPRELEARLTITIVCLLSLIAYNFVIDAELPKLEYLTVLDWVVLISYIYATIPNFLSILSFRLKKTNPKISDKLEIISKRYGLSSYVLGIFLIVLLNANLNPENSSSLISWMAGK